MACFSLGPRNCKWVRSFDFGRIHTVVIKIITNSVILNPHVHQALFSNILFNHFSVTRALGMIYGHKFPTDTISTRWLSSIAGFDSSRLVSCSGLYISHFIYQDVPNTHASESFLSRLNTYFPRFLRPSWLKNQIRIWWKETHQFAGREPKC